MRRTQRWERLRRLAWSTVAICAIAVPTVAAIGTDAHAATRYLDLYERGNDGFAGPVSTSRLTRNVPHVLTIRGTFSYFPRDQWTSADRICGTPAAAPVYRSPGRPNGRVGADAAFVFADRAAVCGRRGQGITRWSGPQLALSASYKEIGEPMAPRKPAPAPGLVKSHAYDYAVIGTGRKARLRVRDAHTEDNYGRLRMSTRRAVAADCVAGNHVRFGFGSIAQCKVAVRSA